MSTDKNVEVRLPNSLAALSRLHDVVVQFCQRQSIHPDTEFKIDLALDEVVSNIVRYAYDDPQPHEIVVRLKGSRDSVRISVEDDGRPFNPLLVPEIDVNAALSERRPGGLGIHLVRRLLDQVRYQRRPAGNRLILIKRLGKEEKRT
ncbi:MAG: ATP-binding protein [Candidatus Aminicenantes bacterium]|nr:ATP-binding protein [Candidatus Aminicenantes bacterium]